MSWPLAWRGSRAGLARVVVAAVLLVGVALAAWSGLRLYERLHRPPPPRQTDVSLIAGWMTVPYVARTYRVPPDDLYRALGVAPKDNDKQNLDQLGAETGRGPEQAVAVVRETVAADQAAHPPRLPPRPKPGDGA